MEELVTQGLVIHELQIGDYDKLLTVLTPDAGKITVSGKGVKSLKSPHMAATQLFSFSHLHLRKRGGYYYIVDSELIEAFFGIRGDILKFSLASYICDVTTDVTVENEDQTATMRLVLNTLYAIDKNLKDLEVIRGAFQLRMACVCGFMPDLSGCRECMTHDAQRMTLDVLDGNLICGSCRSRLDELDPFEPGAEALRPIISVSPAVLACMRYVTRAKIERFLSFSLDDSEAHAFVSACEKYLLNHLERGFYSLEFYKSLL